MPNFSIRALLLLDAATCAVMALLLLLGAGPISSLTAMPADLLNYAGPLLIPISIVIFVTAFQPINWAVAAVVIGNIGWVLATLAIVFTGIVTPNLLGLLFLGGQAAVVGLFAWLEFAASRDSQNLRLADRGDGGTIQQAPTGPN